MENNIHKTAPAMQGQDMIADTLMRVDEINAHFNKENLPYGFEIDAEGLWFNAKKDNPERIWISDPIFVVASVRDHKNENFARLLQFSDIDGCKHSWIMAMELLASEGVKIIAALLNMGLKISPKKQAKDLLLEYCTKCDPMRKARLVSQGGWFDGTFVLSSHIVGPQHEKIIYQTFSAIEAKFETAGTLTDWKENVAKKARGNSRLLLALSASFTGPLLNLLHHENFGIHFKGCSSLGKSTALRMACSVWGGSENIHTFRATSNALEGIASVYNDRLLCLDELGQIAPIEAGHVVYMLANGQGKGRANQLGFARKQATWRLVFLSTGELSLSQVMNEAGKRVKAGQEVRLVEVPADTSHYGLFEDLHGLERGADFSSFLCDVCKKCYGVAGVAFLEKLIEDKEGAIQRVTAIINGVRQRFLPLSASPQVIRVFNHLALVAAAGELSSKFGISGWEIEEALHGVMKCFQDWLKARGDLGMHEEQEALSQVRSFFELHGESRFTSWDRDTDDKYRTSNRAGYRRTTGDEIEFFVFPDTFRQDICKGLDYHFVEKICIQHKLLLPAADGTPTRVERLPGLSKNKRCYRFISEVLSGTDGDVKNDTIISSESIEDKKY